MHVHWVRYKVKRCMYIQSCECRYGWKSSQMHDAQLEQNYMPKYPANRIFPLMICHSLYGLFNPSCLVTPMIKWDGSLHSNCIEQSVLEYY